MKKYYLYKIVCLLLLVGGNFSCTSDLNFDQVNDLKLKPVYEANFSYFDIPATAFVIIPNPLINVQEFDFFRDKYLNNNLQKVDFYFEINNTINRALKFKIILLDANNYPLNSMNFDIPAYSGSSNIVKKTEIFENMRLELLKRATSMRFFIELEPGPALDSSSTGSIVLRSSATVYLEI